MANLDGSPNYSGSQTAYQRALNVDAKTQTIGDLTIQITVNTLRTRITPGAVVYASDINSIVSLLNSVNGHYHSFTSWRRTGTAPDFGVFGDTGDPAFDRTRYTEESSSSSVISNTANVRDTVPTVTQNTNITAASHNALATQARVISNHKHVWSDSTMDLAGA
jgi:hypothetical protein